jgi:hypothetical protein
MDKDQPFLTPPVISQKQRFAAATPVQQYGQIEGAITEDTARKIAVALYRRASDQGFASISGMGAPAIRSFIDDKYKVKVSLNFIHKKFKEWYQDDLKTPKKTSSEFESPWKEKLENRKRKHPEEPEEDLDDSLQPPPPGSSKEYDCAMTVEMLMEAPRDDPDDDGTWGMDCGDDDHSGQPQTSDDSESHLASLYDDRGQNSSPTLVTNMDHSTGHCSCQCKGIGSGDQENLDEFAGRTLRDTGADFQDPEYVESLKNRYAGSNESLSVYEAAARYNNESGKPKAVTYIEGDRGVIARSPFCTRTPMPNEAHACKPDGVYTCTQCEFIQDSTQTKISRAVPFDGTIHKNTTHENISKNPDACLQRLREQSKTIKSLRAQNQRLFLQKRQKEEKWVLEKKPEKVAAMKRALETVSDKLDDGETDEDSKSFFRVYMEHFHRNSCIYFENGEKRTTGMAYDPMIMDYALCLLAKTSHTVYESIADVMQLPTLSTVRPIAWMILTTYAHLLTLSFPLSFIIVYIGLEETERVCWKARCCSRLFRNSFGHNQEDRRRSHQARALARLSTSRGSVVI